jgi:hypothetical protein
MRKTRLGLKSHEIKKKGDSGDGLERVCWRKAGNNSCLETLPALVRHLTTRAESNYLSLRSRATGDSEFRRFLP